MHVLSMHAAESMWQPRMLPTENTTIRRLFTFLTVVPFVSSRTVDTAVVKTAVETSAFTIVQTRRRFTLIIHYINTVKFCTKAIVVILMKHGHYSHKNNASLYA